MYNKILQPYNFTGGVSGIPVTQAENEKVNIIISKQDLASQNIKRTLLQMREWAPIDIDCDQVVFAAGFKKFRLVEIEGLHIYQNGLDTALTKCGFGSDIIIFASKHRSKDGRPILSVHPTGNSREANYGGNPMELSVAAPQAMRSIYLNLKLLSRDEVFQVALESTHHGPSNLMTPSLFVEIGSSEKEWIDPVAGRIVADAILMLANENVPVSVGFGGNHYAPRQAQLLETTEVAFGHIFPSYKLDEMDESLILKAFETSSADFAYIDRKSISKKQRERLTSIINGLGYEVLRERDITEMDGVPWQFCRELQKKLNEICPSGRTRFTENIKCELQRICQDCVCPKVKVATISPELLSEAEKLDRRRLQSFLGKFSIAYLEHNNGRFSHIVIAIDDDCARRVAEELTNECINILKEHYLIKYDKDEGMVYLISNKFSPALARKLGITSGPMFGDLARGKTVTVGSRTIKPDMVFETIEKAIRVKKY